MEDECERPAQLNCVWPTSVKSRACTGVLGPADQASWHTPGAQLVQEENGNAYWKWSKASMAGLPEAWLNLPKQPGMCSPTSSFVNSSEGYREQSLSLREDTKLTKCAGDIVV